VKISDGIVKSNSKEQQFISHLSIEPAREKQRKKQKKKGGKSKMNQFSLLLFDESIILFGIYPDFRPRPGHLMKIKMKIKGLMKVKVTFCDLFS